jgi:hypothetical protein
MVELVPMTIFPFKVLIYNIQHIIWLFRHVLHRINI